MISVCLTTFNGEKYLEKQLSSILTQLGKDDEVVVSDDGSTDSTLSIIDGLNDTRIKVLHHEQLDCDSKYYRINRIVAANFENALTHCKGDYIFLSDQDDIWRPDKVRVMVDFLSQHKNALCLSARTEIDADDNVVLPLVTLNNYNFCIGLATANYLGSSMACDREFLNQALPFPKDTVSHDAWMTLLAKWQKRLFVLDEPLHLYRRHDHNVTLKTVRVPVWHKLAYRAAILVNIIRRSHASKT